jgi:cellulose synthase/poly-beta-1,6-N-acetylglucosamine synthase-like glycosyltransferase
MQGKPQISLRTGRRQATKLSIGLCAHNEEANIEQVISTAVEQTKKLGDYEVVVVASGCTDRTVQIVRDVAEKETGISLIVESQRKGKASALNLLFQNLHGEVYVQVDADAIPAPGAIHFLLERLKDPRVGAASALPVLTNNRSAAAKVNEALWSLHNLTQLVLNREGRTGHLSGQLFAIRRSLCYSIPKNVVNDDAFLALRSTGRGYNIVFEPRAIVFVNPAETFRDLLIQRKRIVYGHLMLRRLTGRPPRIFETCTAKEKIRILSIWVRRRTKELPSLIVLASLELIAHLLARSDLRNCGNPHISWTIATTTKRSLISPRSRQNDSAFIKASGKPHLLRSWECQ